MDKGGGGCRPEKTRANVCLSFVCPSEKKRKKKERNAFFFAVEFTETTFRNLVVSKVVEHRFVRCFKTHAVGEIDREEIYL
jgi:hypothetical protein